jgi:hypothetical protein
MEPLPERWFEDIPASDTSVQRSYVFQSIPGVVYQFETSSDLSTWTSESEIYGLGHQHVIPIAEVAAPASAPPPDPSNPPVHLVPYRSVSLKVQLAEGAAGGVVLSWPSLDHGGPMVYRIDGSLHQGWEVALLFTERYEDFYFFIHYPNSPITPPIENPELGSEDAEMVATFEANLGDMNQIVAASQVRARAIPPPAPSSSDSRLFVRIRVDWTRDTDGDGTPDWIEEAMSADVNHPQRALANTFASDFDGDGTADGAQLDFDSDGTTDVFDASKSDKAIYWTRSDTPRFAVFPLPNFQGSLEPELP